MCYTDPLIDVSVTTVTYLGQEKLLIWKQQHSLTPQGEGGGQTRYLVCYMSVNLDFFVSTNAFFPSLLTFLFIFVMVLLMVLFNITLDNPFKTCRLQLELKTVSEGKLHSPISKGCDPWRPSVMCGQVLKDEKLFIRCLSGLFFLSLKVKATHPFGSLLISLFVMSDMWEKVGQHFTANL